MARRRPIRPVLGALAVATAVLGGAATADAQESSSPVIERLELDEAAVVDHVGANPRERGGGFSGGEVQINELFIRYMPDHEVADVFLSLMVVGTIEGCPASWSTLNQTTPEPVVVDSSGKATTTIAAEWVFEQQLPSGGATCLEKVLVDTWVEVVSIDLVFSEDAVSAGVKTQAGTMLLAPAVGDVTGDSGGGTADLSTGAIIPGVGVASPPGEFGEGAGAEDAEPTAEPTTARDGGSSSPFVIMILIIILVGFAAWLARALIRRFFPALGVEGFSGIALALGARRTGVRSTDADQPAVQTKTSNPEPLPAGMSTIVGPTSRVYLDKKIEVDATGRDDQTVLFRPGDKLWKGEPHAGRTPIFNRDGKLIGTIDTAEFERSELKA